MGKLEGKIAVITGATSGMALATAKLFVEEGAYVFITGRRQEQLDKAVKEIGRNVTGVQGDAGSLSDLDRLYAKVKSEKGRVDVVFASAGVGHGNGRVTHFLRPVGACSGVRVTHGLRRGLHSRAAPRLIPRQCSGTRKQDGRDARPPLLTARLRESPAPAA